MNALRRLAEREYLFATLVLGLIACVWFWPLLRGHQLGQAYTLFSLPPWAAQAPAEALPARLVFPDVALQLWPWAELARDQLGQGQLPLWNPHEYGGGMTLVGNMQSALAFPLTWLLLVLPLGYAWGVLAAAKVLVAGVGAYALARELRVGRGGALLTGTTYMLSGPMMALLQWTLAGVFAVFPWLLLALTVALRRHSPGAVAAVAAAFALLVAAGHPESALIASSAAAVYALTLALSERTGERSPRRLLGALGRWGAGLLLGVALAAVVVVPFAQAFFRSVTRLEHGSAGAFFELPLTSVLQFALPGIFGHGEPELYGYPNFVFVSGYFGLPALVLAAVAAVRLRRLPAVRAVAAMALVALLAAYRVPPVSWFLENVPPWADSLIGERAFFVIALAGALGAGAGLSAVAARPLALPRAALVAAGAAGILGLAVLAAQLRGALEAPGEAKLAALGFSALLLLGTGVVLGAAGRVRPAALVAGALALGVLSVAGMQNLNVTLPPEKAYPGTPESIRALAAQRDPFHLGVVRAPGRSSPLLPNTAALYGLEALEGYDFPLSERWSAFQTRALRFRGTNPEGRTFGGPPAGPVLTATRMMNTRFWLAAPGTPPPQPEFETIHDGPDATVFRDRRALPRAYVVPTTERVTDDVALDRIAAGRLDPRRLALVPPGAPPAPSGGRGFLPARAERISPEHIRVHLPAGSAGWLVLASAHSPEWEAEVDGSPTELHPTNHAAMGVPVRAGARTVDFRHSRDGFWTGAAISLVALALTLLLAGWSRLAARRR